MRERAEAILPETTLTRTRVPVYYDDTIQTVIVTELVVDPPASQPPPTPSPPVPTTEAAEQQTQETGMADPEVNEMILEHYADTIRRRAISLGISGLVWGALAACFGLVPMAIATTVAVVLACLTLIYRVCSQEVAPIEEID